MKLIRLSPTLLAALALACPAQSAPSGAGAPAPLSAAAAAVPPVPTVDAPPRDERRPDRPFSVDLAGTPVQLGGSWEYTDERRLNFDLDDTAARDRRVREHEVKLETRVRLGERTELFAQLVGLHETRRTEGTAGQRITRSLERGPMWLQFERLGGTPWSLQVGRVSLLDRRAWWWDEDLDAVRLRYAGEAWRLDTGLGRELARKSSADAGIVPAERGVTRFFGQATWAWAPRHAIDAFWLVQRDGSGAPAAGAMFANEDATDPGDLRARWTGLRASGEWRADGGSRLAYWADAARLSGREVTTAFAEQSDGTFTAAAAQSRRVSGRAHDVGVTATLGVPLRPSLTLAHARGSEGFRQTGLQENKARIGGVKRWQRYGELLQPELSNLAVSSAGVGVRLTDNTSLELVGHREPAMSAWSPAPAWPRWATMWCAWTWTPRKIETACAPAAFRSTSPGWSRWCSATMASGPPAVHHRCGRGDAHGTRCSSSPWARRRTRTARADLQYVLAAARAIGRHDGLQGGGGQEHRAGGHGRPRARGDRGRTGGARRAGRSRWCPTPSSSRKARRWRTSCARPHRGRRRHERRCGADARAVCAVQPQPRQAAW
jgi:hypothetical protein